MYHVGMPLAEEPDLTAPKDSQAFVRSFYPTKSPHRISGGTTEPFEASIRLHLCRFERARLYKIAEVTYQDVTMLPLLLFGVLQTGHRFLDSFTLPGLVDFLGLLNCEQNGRLSVWSSVFEIA